MNHMLKSAYTNLEPVQVMQAPVSALLGVSPKAEELLKTALNIRSIFDLATSRVFSNASLIVRSSEGDATVVSRSGMVSSDMIDQSILLTEIPDLKELVTKDVQYLNGVGPHTGPLVKEVLDAATIRDLAYWPPYVNARTLLESFAGETPQAVNESATPPDLLPLSGQYPTERTQYSMLLFERLVIPRTLAPIENGVNLDVMAAQDSLASENVPALGALVSYTQSWYTLGLALGQLLHSLALAPGESTRVAVIDWYRRLQSATTETDQEKDVLVSDLTRNRSLNEVVSAVAAEFQRGNANTYTRAESENFGVGFGYGTGTGGTASGSYGMFSGLVSAGDAMGFGLSGGYASGSGQAWTWSSTQGKREMAADMAQRILDQTHQSSMMARDRWASVVREVSQKEQESLSTRAVTNFNHMHALTVQYYEVVQIYRVVVELSKITRCLFVPMRQLDFSGPKTAMRFRYILAKAALIPGVRALAIAEPESLFIRFPNSGPLTQVLLDMYNGFGWSVMPGGVSVPEDEHFQIELFVFNSSDGTPCPFQSLILEFQDGKCKECPIHNYPEPGYAVYAKDVLGHDATIPLSSIERISLRKAAGKESYSGPYNNVRLFDPSGKLMAVWPGLDVPADKQSFVALEITSFAEEAWSKVAEHLEENRLYYNQAVWQGVEPAILTHMLSSYSFSGRPLLNMIDSKPIGVAGCYLVFPLNLEDESWKQFLHSTGLNAGIRQESLIPLPSGGVFAEAVLGRANSAEKLDITRFWNWADSPIPITAPDIAALSSGSRANPAAEGDQPQGFGAPVLNIMNAPAAPDPTGLAAILAAIQNGNMFRDMSGLSGAIGLAQASLANAMQAAQAAAGTAAGEAKAAMEQAGKNLATAAEAFESVYGKGGKAAGGLTGAGANGAGGKISEIGARYNAAENLDREANGSAGSSSGAPSAESAAITTRRDEVLGLNGGLAQAPASQPEVATDASTPGYTSISSDAALLDSNLVTDPTFSDVEGFVFLLQAAKDADLIPLLIRRFDSIGTGVNALQKHAELLAEIQRRQVSLENFEQMLFAAQFVKNGMWPDPSGFTEAKVADVKERALHLMTQYALRTAQTTNPEPAVYDIVNSICEQAYARRVCDINHLAYILATAHHESRMGYWMLERSPENYAPNDAAFARDAYFFDRLPGKASYNGVNGNRLAGDQLVERHVIADADKAIWNGVAYPHGQPQDVKLAARECDFYIYSGKGLVQVTGRDNYRRYSNLPELDHEDFEANPDKVTEFRFAAAILILGLECGYCNRGKRLGNYDNDNNRTFDAFNARDIVNGDKNLFPRDANGNPVGTESFGQKIRRIAQEYKAGLIQFPALDESRTMV
jgi:hypothetical protein